MDIGLAIIIHPIDRTILITKRPRYVHLPGFWEFPGGMCRAGESPADCAVREAREETGIDVVPVEVWPPVTHAYPERLVTLHPVLCEASTTDARPNASVDLAWVAAAELGDFSFPSANATIIARLQFGLCP
jgi:mutator protein MutT